MYIHFRFLPLLDILTLHCAVFQVHDPCSAMMVKSASEIRFIDGNGCIPSSSLVSELY